MQNLFIALITILLVVGCGSGNHYPTTTVEPTVRPIVRLSTVIDRNTSILLNYTIETNESIEMAILKLVIKDASGNIFKKDSLYVTDYIDMNSSWKETFTEPLYGFQRGEYTLITELRDGKNRILTSSSQTFIINNDVAGENVYLEEFELQKIYKDHPTRLKSGREASVKIKTNTSVSVFVYILLLNQLELVAEEWIEDGIIDFTVPDFESGRAKIFVTFHPLSGDLEEAKKASRKNGTFFYIVP